MSLGKPDLRGKSEAFRAHVVSYADDFVILSRGKAQAAVTWTRGVMAQLGLTINEAKTSVKDARVDKVSEILVAGNPGTWDEVSDRLNAVLRGWSGYFAYGWRMEAYRAVDRHVTERVGGFLTRRHKVRGRGYKEFPDHRIHGDLGVLRLVRKGNDIRPWAGRESSRRAGCGKPARPVR